MAIDTEIQFDRYLDIRTGEIKPRHKPQFGAQNVRINGRTWQVSTDEEMFNALEDARTSGGKVELLDTIVVNRTVRVPNNVFVTGGGIKAIPEGEFKGNHLVSIRGAAQNIWLHNVDIDASGRTDIEMRTLPIMEESKNIVISECNIHHGWTGIAISGGASNITIYNCNSYGHRVFHGIAVEHSDCESIVILGCHCYDNGGYGINTHGTFGEIAGCICEGNGRTDNHRGVAAKAADARKMWIHDCTFDNADVGLPLFRIYTKDRVPEDVYIYRCALIGENHIAADRGTVLKFDELTAYDYEENGDTGIVSLRVGGSGQCVLDFSLRDFPYTIEDEPTDPKPGELFTAEQVESIRQIAREEAFQVVQEEMKHLELIYTPLGE